MNPFQLALQKCVRKLLQGKRMSLLLNYFYCLAGFRHAVMFNEGSMMVDWIVLFIWWWVTGPIHTLNGREQTAVLLVSWGWTEIKCPPCCSSIRTSLICMNPLLPYFCFYLALLLVFSDVGDSLYSMSPICASLSATCWTDRMRDSQKTVAGFLCFFCSWSK